MTRPQVWLGPASLLSFEGNLVDLEYMPRVDVLGHCGNLNATLMDATRQGAWPAASMLTPTSPS